MTALRFDQVRCARFGNVLQTEIGTGMPFRGQCGGAGRGIGLIPLSLSKSTRPPTPWPPGIAGRKVTMTCSGVNPAVMRLQERSSRL